MLSTEERFKMAEDQLMQMEKCKPQPSPREQFKHNFHQFLNKMLDTMEKKNADYTGASDDPFANFSRVQALDICTTEQGFLTRMTDKLCRIASFAKRGKLSVESESVEDTLLDLANYAVIMACYIRTKESKAG